MFQKKPKKIFLLATLMVLAITASTFGEEGRNGQVNEYYKSMISKIWQNRKEFFMSSMKNNLAKGYTYELYSIQIQTNNLLRYAYIRKDYAMLNDLICIYEISLKYLTVDKDGIRKWIFTDKGSTYAKENPGLIDKEIQLCSCQFLYLTSSAVNMVSALDKGNRTVEMVTFANNFAPLAIHGHYSRWVKELSPVFEKKIKKENRKEPYKDAVSDKEMWIVAGIVELLAANDHDKDLVSMTKDVKKTFKNFVVLGTKLIQSRLTESLLADFHGKPVKGLNFDIGMRDTFETYAYSGYTGEKYPTLADKKSARNVGWDISHARRFVNVFDTLYENRKVTGQTFPDKETMIKLTNQVVYGVFNKDFEHPLFTNYMDGTNGWYRVGYAGRKNFGYGPYMLSGSIPNGGYGFWTKYNPDMGKVLNAFWHMAQKDTNSAFIEKYYNKNYNDRKNYSLELLQFLPSMASDMNK